MDDYELETKFWGEPPVAAAARKRKKRRTALQLSVLMILLFVSLGFLGYQLADRWLTEGLSIEQPSINENEVPAPANPGKLSLLLLGVDKRGNEASRADTIMVAFIDAEQGLVNILSIPRDTYIEVPGYGHTKINHAHAYGGPELVAETVSEFLGVPVNKYVEVDFEGFKDLIDILGGVRINVEKRMYYSPEGINLQPGEQVLDGEKALQYVRYRGREGDIGRIERQQKFLKTVAEQAVNFGTVFKLPSLINEIRESTSTNLTIREMLALAKVAKGINVSEMETAMVPGTPVYIDGISYWEPDEKETFELVDKFLARNDI